MPLLALAAPGGCEVALRESGVTLELGSGVRAAQESFFGAATASR